MAAGTPAGPIDAVIECRHDCYDEAIQMYLRTDGRTDGCTYVCFRLEVYFPIEDKALVHKW